ncbi:MAG: hypothetical protein HN368_22495 [Spirochaetales bacterium]|jgi:hypothetical protein|nr:hypothetical protein [Spirochaetales bacterium]
MKRTMIFVFCSLFLLFACSQVFGSDNWVYVLLEDSIHVFNSDSTEYAGEIELSRSGAVKLFPTPGGKYVFITFRSSSEVAVIDAESRSLTGFVTFPVYPQTITFAEMGKRAFVSDSGSGDVYLYSHKQADFQLDGVVEKGSRSESVLANRLGTRIYRPDEKSIEFIYLKDYSTLARIALPESVGALSLSPDYRTIWIVGQSEGKLIVIDEERRRVAKRVKGSFASETPAYWNRLAVLLNSDRMGFTLFSTRTFRESDTRALIEPSLGIALSESGELWSLTAGGVEINSVDDSDSGERISVSYGSLPKDIKAVVLRSGEGFACF